MSLADKAVLVSLSIRQFTGRKFDKDQSEQVAQRNGVSTRAGRYNKALFPESDVLNAVNAATTAARKFHLDNTLPWGINGLQMLPSKNFFAYQRGMADAKFNWEHAVQKFLREYDSLVDDARRGLRGMFKETDYPTLNSMRNRFAFDVNIIPVPETDFRVELTPEELAALEEGVKQKLQAVGDEAIKEIWSRMYDHVEAVAEKLSDPKKIIRDSVVENTRELCALIDKLNFSDDPDVERMRSAVLRQLGLINPETLRLDPEVRSNAAAEAKAIMDKMKDFM